MLPSSISSSEAPAGRRFSFECVLFAGLLLALHAAVYAVRGAPDMPRDLEAFFQTAREPSTDVVYFGDSSLFMGRRGEPDARSIPELLQQRLPQLRIAEVSGAAAQMELFELFCAYLAHSPSGVRTVIIPLNMRMLAPQLEQRSYRYFDRERAFLDANSTIFNVLYRPLNVFKAFNTRTARPDEFADAPVLDGRTNLGRLGEFNPAISVPVVPEQRRRIVTFSYMFELTGADPVVRRLESALESLERAGISAVLYVTPIDYEACRDDVGPRFLDRVAANVALLERVSASHGANFVDLSIAVEHAHFAWEHYPNEHLDAAGRARVADALVKPVLAATEAAR